MFGVVDIVCYYDSDLLENFWVDGQLLSVVSNGWWIIIGVRSC